MAEACPHLSASAAAGCSSDAADAIKCPVTGAKTSSVLFESTSQYQPLSRIPATNTEDATETLPDARQISSIPRSSTTKNTDQSTLTEYWVYPSQKQFYEAMKRKNYRPREEDMSVIVPMHNIINEMAWQKILKWELKYKQTCGNPRLKQFMGKPDEPSPKARLLSWFGYSTPFDRHDWVVDRCGQDVRYVLDFYQGNQPGVSVHIDARPAVTDSLQNALDYFGDFIRGIF